MTESFSYGDFEATVRAIRAKTARFHRIDLHVHTIDSHDFPSIHSKPGFVTSIPDDEAGLKSRPEEFKRRFVQRAKEQGLRLIAVTDHNESDMAEQLAAMSDDELAILPGIEISAQNSLFRDSEVHLIGIFPKGTSSKQIDKVFPPGCGMPPSGNRGAGVVTSQPISEIIKNIRNLKGICIAAHVSSTNGIRTMVHSQHVEWLQKNYLRRYLKERRKKDGITPDELAYLQKLDAQLKPLDDELQNAYLQFLAEHDFNAIQVQEWEHQLYYTGIHVEALNLTPFPCILSTDAHTLADLGCYGHATHIKMTEVGLDGLQKAFLDPGTRIRNDATVPTIKPKRIMGISFDGGSLDKQVIGFSDNLSTLIGGRGTGKSALIEAIRFVLCQPIIGLPNRLRKDIQERLEFTMRDTDIKLLFAGEQEEATFVLKRQLGEARTSCFTLEGEALPEIELPASQRVRAEIYGWNEIEALSDSPRKQLGLLDRTVPGIDEHKLELHKRREELRANGERIVALAREVYDLLPHTQGAGEMRQQLQGLSTPELNEAFASYDQNQAAISALGKLESEIEAVRGSLLDDGQEQDLGRKINRTLEDSKESLQSYAWYDELSQVISQGTANAQKLYDQLLAELDAVRKKVNNYTGPLEEERNKIETQLNSMAEKSGQADFKTALSRRKELTESLSRISGFEKDIEEKQEEIERLFSVRRSQIIPNLADAQSKIYKARVDKAAAIAQKLSALQAAKGVRIEIEHLGDREAFSRALGYRDGQKYEGLFRRIDRHYLSKDYPGFYARRFSPHDFVNIFIEDISDCDALVIRYIRKRDDQSGKIVRLIEGAVAEQGKKIIEHSPEGEIVGKWPTSEFELVIMEEAQKIWKHLSPHYYDNEINVHYDPEKLKNILELELSDIEDRPRILLDDRPIEELSPGQRCSALIPIILVEGNNPLLIDQPEDNLDNKMVFDLVVDILRGLKEQRQIIVATHNPNIPVSGDAEQVIVFDSPSKEECCIAAQGSIDDESIVKNIKTIMEGGDKAFEVRMKKYGMMRNVHSESH